MLTYIIRRLLLVPLLLFGVTVLIFAMLQFLSPVERSALYVRDIPQNDKARCRRLLTDTKLGQTDL